MWDKIERYVREYSLIEKGEHILVGLSGGADSVCLLHFLLNISDKYALKIYAVHVNHMIREIGAKRDQAFVEKLCQDYGIPLKVYAVDVEGYAKEHRQTVEEAGRAVRYRCFEEMAREWSCSKIAVAHHRDDLAETVLFRMIRGTGLEGIGAMEPVSGNKIRPLLCVSKDEILELLSKLNQNFMEDETNQETTYSRNYIRHEIMPAMNEVNPKATEHIAQLALQTQELQQFLSPMIAQSYEQCVKREKDRLCLSISQYQNYHAFIQKEVLRLALFEASKRRKDISFVHIRQLQDLIEQSEGKRVDLPYHIIAQRTKNQLCFFDREVYESRQQEEADSIFYTIPNMEEREEFELKTREGICLHFHLESVLNSVDYTKGDCIQYFDYDKINGRICIRNKRDGDYFIVDRYHHKKALRRYFIDAKIPKEERAHRLLMAVDSHVLWILGGRISEICKVTEDTTRVLKVTLSEEVSDKTQNTIL